MSEEKHSKKEKNAQKSSPIEELHLVLEETQTLFFSTVKPLITEYFNSVDHILLRLSERSDSEKKRKLYEDALKSIRVYKLNVLSSFLKSLKHTFTKFISQDYDYFEDKITKVVKKNHSVADAVDKNDVMEKVAQNALIHESEVFYQQRLKALQHQFSVLFSQDLGLFHLPVGPYVLVSAFAKSIRLLHLDLKVKHILYKHFERTLMQKLNDVYQQIDTHLTNKTEINQSLEDSEPYPKIDQKNQDVNFIHNILITLQQQALVTLTKTGDWPYSPAQTQKQLMHHIEQSQRSIDKHNIETFNMVTMMFQMIVDNRNIPEALSDIIIRLQIAYTKAAIFDESLLNNKSHPAQALLVLMANNTIGWSAESDPNEHFINKVSDIVNVIMHENHLDKALFSQQLDEFTRFLDNYGNDFEDAKQKAKEKNVGRDKIVSAMKTVEALLSHKIEDVQNMPAEIKKILLGPWKNVLALLLVRESNTSPTYLNKVAFIDDVINILTPKKFEMIMQQNISKLCNDYTEGLKLVAYSGVELQNKTEELYLALLKLHQLKDRRQDMDYINEQSSQGPIKSTERLFEAVKHIDYSNNSPDLADLNIRDQKILSKIKIGMWLSFLDDNDELFDAKLSWISPRSGKYLFVNSKGLKTLDRTPQELAKGINNKSINIVNKRK